MAKLSTHYERDHHECFEQPPPATALWRYMSLAKLVSLVHTKQLYFARTDLLGDPFEGSWARKQPMREAGWSIGGSPELEAARARVSTEVARGSVVVNCWHLGEAESAAMWKLYAESGLAISTTFARLTESLPQKLTPDHDSIPIYVGKVKYIDYQTESVPEGNAYWPFMCKHHSFRHEQEVRAMIYRVGDGMREYRDLGMSHREPGFVSPGLDVPIDVTKLISRVYVSPASQPWFADAVRAVLRSFGSEAEVVSSALDATPIY